MSQSERRKALIESIKKMNKEVGGDSPLIEFSDTSEDKEIIPSGIPAVDEFIGGGWKAGAFSVIYGAESTGKSTLVLQAIAHAQKMGKTCCYIDLEHSFEKERAVSLGIKLDDLVLSERCSSAEQALTIIRDFCKAKVIDLFVVDSIQAMSPLNQQQNKGKDRGLEEKEIAELARTLSKFFTVVSPDVFRAKAAVIMIGQVRIGGIGSFFVRATLSGGEALKHWANMRLFIRTGQGADAPTEKVKKTIVTPDGPITKTINDPIGFDCVMKLEKTKSSKASKQGGEIHVPFYFKSGFHPPVPAAEGVVTVKELVEGNDEAQKGDSEEATKNLTSPDVVKKKRGRKPGKKNDQK